MSLRETLDRMRSAPVPRNEQEVITQILLILRDLSWDPFGQEVRQEYTVGGKDGGRVDIALAGRRRIVALIEAKAPREDLNRHVGQIVKYAFHEGADICVLTNGLEWWLYVPMERVPFEERRFATLRIRTDPVEQLQDDLESFVSRKHLVSGRALCLARRRYKLNRAIPKVWHDILTGPDDALLDLVSQRVYEEVDLQPTREELLKVLRSSRPPTVVPPVPPNPHPPPHPKRSPKKPPIPTGIRLWGQQHDVRFCVDVLRRVAEALHERHVSDFDRILTLRGTKRQYASRDPGDLRPILGTYVVQTR